MSRLPNSIETEREQLEGVLGSLAYARAYLRLSHDRVVVAANIGQAALLTPAIGDLVEAEQLITRAQAALAGQPARPVAARAKVVSQ